MTLDSLTENQLKQIVKTAILEIFQEQRDTIFDLLAETLEDLAMVRAIEEGKETEPVSRDEIFKLLDGHED